MHLIPRMATALVFFIYIGEEGLNAQFLTKKYQTPRQLCGAALSNELQLVCGGVYNNMIKKSEGPGQARTVRQALELIRSLTPLPPKKKCPRSDGIARLNQRRQNKIIFRRPIRGVQQASRLSQPSPRPNSSLIAVEIS